MASIETVATAEFPPASEISLQALQSRPTAAQSRLQMAWDGQMKDTNQGRKFYKKTVALLLSWKNSDLNTGEEVIATTDRHVSRD
jgi:hypothetical protein